MCLRVSCGVLECFTDLSRCPNGCDIGFTCIHSSTGFVKCKVPLVKNHVILMAMVGLLLLKLLAVRLPDAADGDGVESPEPMSPGDVAFL